jgi:antitoxin HigA-1
MLERRRYVGLKFLWQAGSWKLLTQASSSLRASVYRQMQSANEAKKQLCVHNYAYICVMKNNISIIKGVHPGIILERELKRRKLPKGRFALEVNEYPQTVVAVTKGKRRMTPALALKAEKALGLEEGYFLTLQVWYDIKKEKSGRGDPCGRTNPRGRPNLRPALFWDTDINTINWDKHKTAVIKRVLERGNETEKNEIARFYGYHNAGEMIDHVSPE